MDTQTTNKSPLTLKHVLYNIMTGIKENNYVETRLYFEIAANYIKKWPILMCDDTTYQTIRLAANYLIAYHS